MSVRSPKTLVEISSGALTAEELLTTEALQALGLVAVAAVQQICVAGPVLQIDSLWPVAAVVMPEPLVVTTTVWLEHRTAIMVQLVVDKLLKSFGQSAEPMHRSEPPDP